MRACDITDIILRHATCYHEARQQRWLTPRVVRGGMPGRGDQGSADDARVTFPVSGNVSSTITCNFNHVDQAML